MDKIGFGWFCVELFFVSFFLVVFGGVAVEMSKQDGKTKRKKGERIWRKMIEDSR